MLYASYIYIYIYFCSNVSADEGTSSGGATRAGVVTRGATFDQSTSNKQMGVLSAYDKMLMLHPVTVDAVAPSKAERDAISPDHARSIYERWLKAQMKLRVNEVRCKFFSHLTTIIK